MKCVHEPISRFSLELYLLDELPADRRSSVRDHLTSCDACTAVLRHIESDNRPLPPLRLQDRRSTLEWIHRFGTFRTAFATAVAAILALSVFLLYPKPPASEYAEPIPTVKGGETSLFLVRQRRGTVSDRPAAFAKGDQFKVFVSRPGSEPTQWELAVFQGDEVYFPLDNVLPLAPGNRSPLPGALALDGDAPATLCLFTGPDTPLRSRLREEKRRFISTADTCVTLKPDTTNR